MARSKYLLIIAGPTAVGKTDLSIQLAKHFTTEIISADSRQVYKEISIGTAKPSVEEQQGVKHHFIDCISIHQNYTAGDFEKEVISKLDELFKTHDLVIMCGGSGLFIDAVCNGFDEGLVSDAETKKEINEEYNAKGLKWLQDEIAEHDPVYFNSADINNPHRLMRALEVIRLSGLPFSDFRKNKKAIRNFEAIKILINEEREVLYNKINRRVDLMMKNGLLEEAQNVYPYKNLNALNTVGYKELFDHFDKQTSLDKAVELIKQHSRNYAKRQLTWFRKNNDYEIFGPGDLEKIKAYVEIILQNS
ncbi:MAG: tRNA (adenosine(37)-N6)-dimethylallyltransferase MiaA [Bacteroidia bacterium]